jgi:2-polyprenyl-3-methyl-5-hydroxy-6-metoxy-1,4-benzoquinol methylase
MVFANNIKSQAEFDAYYLSCNKYEAVAASTALADYQQAIIDYICKLDKSLRIADFGCGTGDLLKELQNHGFTNLFALDTSESNCDSLRKTGINAICKSVFEISDVDYPDKLDVIVNCAVLEHVVDLYGFMERVLSVLDQNGSLIICVPRLDAESGKTKPFQEFSIEHINYFSYNTLHGLLNTFALESIAQLAGNSTTTLVAKKCHEISVRKYIENSLSSVEAALLKIDGLIETQSPVVVWGVGTLSRYLLSNTRFKQLNILAFIDRDTHYQGKLIDGVKVLSPNEIASVIADEPIIITAYDANDAITRTIRQDLELDNEIIYFL